MPAGVQTQRPRGGGTHRPPKHVPANCSPACREAPVLLQTGTAASAGGLVCLLSYRCWEVKSPFDPIKSHISPPQAAGWVLPVPPAFLKPRMDLTQRRRSTLGITDIQKVQQVPQGLLGGDREHGRTFCSSSPQGKPREAASTANPLRSSL